MKRRVLAVLLVLTMVIGLASCGSKKSNSGDDVSLSAVIEKMADMENGKSEVTIDLDTDALKAQQVPFSKIGLKISGQMDKDNEKRAKVEISYKLDSDDYSKFTTMIVDDQVLYLNLKEVKAAASGLLGKLGLSQYESALSALPADEYVKIDPAALAQLSGAVVTAPASDIKINPEDVKKLAKIGTEIAKVVEEAVKEVDPPIITGSGDDVSINISDKNAKPALEALAKADYSACFDSVMKQMESISICKEIVTEYKDKKDSVLKDLKKGFEDGAKEVEKASNFAIDFSVKVDGSKGKRTADTKFSVDVKDSKQYVKMTIAAKSEEGNSEAIDVPANALDFMQLMSSFMQGAGAAGALGGDLGGDIQ